MILRWNILKDYQFQKTSYLLSKKQNNFKNVTGIKTYNKLIRFYFSPLASNVICWQPLPNIPPKPFISEDTFLFPNQTIFILIFINVIQPPSLDMLTWVKINFHFTFLSEWVCELVCEWVNEYVSKWVSVWMSEWVSEWVS